MTTDKQIKTLQSLDRRKIRYRLFRIREGHLGPFDEGLKNFIEKQFTHGETWQNFTFYWDVSPTNPLKVIRQYDWVSEGGSIDIATLILEPPGFTKQEI